MFILPCGTFEGKIYQCYPYIITTRIFYNDKLKGIKYVHSTVVTCTCTQRFNHLPINQNTNIATAHIFQKFTSQ